MNTPRENQQLSRVFHQALLDSIGASTASFYSKMAFMPTAVGLTEKCIGFFESEISKGVDVYVEFGNKEMLPEEVPGFPFRCLLKWRYNPHYKEEYTPSDPNGTTGHVRYFVPISELIIVTKPEVQMLRTITSPTTTVPAVSEERESKVDELAMVPPNNTDVPFSEMTLRDYAAIHLGKPISNRKWLNDLISK